MPASSSAPPDPAQRRELDDLAAQFLISVGDVVALSGRPPWAVAQWRKRVRDRFPDPVEGGRSPQFNAAQVLAWLRRQNDSGQVILPADEPSPAWFFRHAARLLPGATPPAQRQHLRVYVAALVSLGAALRSHVGPSRRATARVIGITSAELEIQASKVERSQPELRGLLVANLALVRPEAGVLTTLALTLDHALRPPSADGADVPLIAAGLLDDALANLTQLAATAPTTHPLVAEITWEIAGHWHAARVLDPACGEGVLMAGLTSGQQELELVGVEMDAAAAATARLRLLLRGVDAEVRQGDALAANDLRNAGFDAVVLDPPIGELGPWIELMSDALTEEGHALVALRAVSLRGSAKSLIKRRQTTAVVLLPPSVRHGGRDTQALAVISKAGGRDEILVLDLSRLRPPVLGEGQSVQMGQLVSRWVDRPDAAEVDRADLTAETGIRTHVVEARRAERTSLVDLIEPEPEMASAAEVRAAVAQLEETLARSERLQRVAELRAALEAFSKANRPDPTA